jgi:hypothetical protein
MPKFRVYRWYVGCDAFEVEAESAQQAAEKLDDNQPHSSVFSHQGNDPLENIFAIDAHPYDEDGDCADTPEHSIMYSDMLAPWLPEGTPTSPSGMAHFVDATVDKFLEKPFEVEAGLEGWGPTVPDGWVEKPFCRIAWAKNPGDPSVGIPGHSGFLLAEDQVGTVVGDMLQAAAVEATRMTLPTDTFLDISTGHLSKATAEMLDATQVKKWPVAGLRGPFGWLVFTHEDSLEYRNPPTDLKACLAFARSRGIRWIKFDCDAETLPDLPTYEW